MTGLLRVLPTSAVASARQAARADFEALLGSTRAIAMSSLITRWWPGTHTTIGPLWPPTEESSDGKP